MNDAIFTTDPHGHHELRHTEDLTFRIGQPIEHQLFTLSDKDGASITFTGEELDSLASQWRDFRNQ